MSPLATTRTVHAWLGVVLAALLAVIGMTGAACTFRPELLRLGVPAADAEPAPPATLGPALQRVQAKTGASIVFVALNAHGRGVHRIYFSNAPDVFIDRDGMVVARAGGLPRPEDLLMSVHHQLLAGRWGEQLTGLAALGGLVLTCTGLIVWVSGRPRLVRPPKSIARRDLLALHRDGAAILSLFVGFQLLTGAALTWESPLRAIVGAEERAFTAPADAGPPDWPAILDAAHRAAPGGEARQIIPAPLPAGGFTVRMRLPGELNPAGETRVLISASGEALAVEYGRDLPPLARLMNGLLGLHSGEHLGPFARPLLFLTGVGLSLLSIIAAWAFLTRPRRYRAPERPNRQAR